MGTKYRRIKSVAHNLGHSFLSDLNFVGEGRRWTIVPRLIFATAAEMRIPRIRLDLLHQHIEPDELALAPVRESVELYTRWLPRLLQSQGVAPESVTAATITMTLDHSRTRQATYLPNESIPEFTCVVAMTDDRGHVHRATPTVWQ